ncbi:DUF2505 domain-containing protein [Marinobacter lutaoensis]|jgi:hypothetical protein|uniref:DUF2505 domain-containing protein n=1 Tax=Marinobacter lutaoensis TaxID=135739 RepID=A0A1V2DRL2_9GAMM|nr:DUF2505 domain-containing protein [Marinobacter lutaoensis]NVD34860.1 DUF2505 domain-containing protein [Marinobacter lutaoensis]ONF43120.1 hypothetical protein BTO32_10515 [Marinobacter lutaoensis]
MEFEVTHAYEAPLEQLLEQFFDETLIREKNARLGARDVVVRELRREPASAKLVVEREVRASQEVPAILASFHREWNSVRQEEHWFRKNEDEWHCEFRVHLAGVPARMTGMMRLLRHGDGCRNQVSLRVRCDLPLIGRKIAGFLTQDSRLKIDLEHEVIKALTAGTAAR